MACGGQPSHLKRGPPQRVIPHQHVKNGGYAGSQSWPRSIECPPTLQTTEK